MTQPEIQILTPITTASSNLADFQRLSSGRGSPSSDRSKQIQALRLFATGVLSGAGATPADATATIVLKNNGKRVWQTTATIATATAQTADTYAVADAEDDEAVCTVSLTDDSRGILDLLGGSIDHDGDSAGEAGDTKNFSWWIYVTAMGGYKSIQLYAVPARRV